MQEFGWDEVEREDLHFLLKHNKVHLLIEEGRESFEKNAEIKVLI